MKKQNKVKFFFHGILKGQYEEVEGKLPGYEQFFRVHSTFKQSKDPKASVPGVIAWVPEEEIESLDMIEGVGYGYYTKFQTKAVTNDGEEHECWVYQQQVDRLQDRAERMKDVYRK